MAHVARQFFTFADYVEVAEESRVKLEFLDGQVWAMSGGTPEHAALSASVIAILSSALRGRPCRAYSSDLRVRVKKTGLATYPDATVICGRLEVDPEDPKQLTAINPTVIVEVLSPSTESYDRGEKLAHYKDIETLQEVVFVAQERHEIEVVRREPDGTWSRWISRGADNARIASLECELPLAEVYRNPLAG